MFNYWSSVKSHSLMPNNGISASIGGIRLDAVRRVDESTDLPVGIYADSFGRGCVDLSSGQSTTAPDGQNRHMIQSRCRRRCS